jgi:hypothetical protein
MCNAWFNNIMFVKVFKSFFIFLEDLLFHVHKFLNLMHFWFIEDKPCQGLPWFFHKHFIRQGHEIMEYTYIHTHTHTHISLMIIPLSLKNVIW